ncbi:MAG: hypothetical protein IPJ38_19185 [Dechloromonas sp.]|uniref:Uncharacterized protein n=1 Tax=Candidatus Dechloromonas phosphorivorans TaxID=2899244 RepID=A0A935MX97_9RHOO|nr:hypothetical protein [Candidatus Dechloromonas phosphorivorans]
MLHDLLEITIAKYQHNHREQGKNKHRRQRKQAKAQANRAMETTLQSVNKAKTRSNDALPWVLISNIKTIYIFSYKE